jgi:hypothetical protein
MTRRGWLRLAAWLASAGAALLAVAAILATAGCGGPSLAAQQPGNVKTCHTMRAQHIWSAVMHANGTAPLNYAAQEFTDVNIDDALAQHGTALRHNLDVLLRTDTAASQERRGARVAADCRALGVKVGG